MLGRDHVSIIFCQVQCYSCSPLMLYAGGTARKDDLSTTENEAYGIHSTFPVLTENVPVYETVK